jgi:prepilin-type N-terminal cleavage/methylation domain-containing protein
MKTRQTNQKERGFTIIEVLIVLAIAGVIMLIIFLAVPALQRNSRNTQRRSDASHYAGLINEWMANHAGQTATSENVAGGATGPDLANETFSLIAKPAAGTALPASANPWTAPGSPALDTFYPYSNATCQSTGVAPTYSSSARSIVIVYYVEPGTTLQCTQV